ncbi:MAG: VanZ family protein [Antricoccus sp.]
MLAVIFGGGAFVVLLLPILLVQHRQYGRIDPRRFVGAAIGSFYGAGVLAFTILPVPDTTAAWCARNAIRHAVLRPFHSLDAIRISVAGESLPQILGNVTVLQSVFNVLMFLPLGILLRRYLGRSVLVSTLIAMALSVLIEFTQYTGNWGIAGCAYRYADIDDVITNTLGAFLGALIAPAFLWWMPRGGDLRASRLLARPVTLLRRWSGMAIDGVLFALCGLLSIETVVVVYSQFGLVPSIDPRIVVVGVVMGVPALLVVLLPVCVGSGASWGQRLVWLRPVRAATRPNIVRRLVGVLVAWVPVVASAAMWLANVSGDRAHTWDVAVVAFIALSFLLVAATPRRRGLSGLLSGIEYADSRAARASDRCQLDATGQTVMAPDVPQSAISASSLTDR